MTLSQRSGRTSILSNLGVWGPECSDSEQTDLETDLETEE